jgi:hypothetical protein
MNAPKSITIIGRRWFQRSYGNTYHSVDIYLDGEHIYLPKAYGYGDYYLQRATEELDRRGLLPGLAHHDNGSVEPLWQYCRDRGIACDYRATDVSRQKDL